MVKRIAAGREQHAVNFDAETYAWLQEFTEDNDIPDNGTAISALADFYRTVMLELPRLREAAAEGERLSAQASKQQAELDLRETRLRVWEEQAAAAAQIPYLPVQGTKALLDAGMGVQDIYDLHQVVVSSGLPPQELAGALERLGGAAVMEKALNDRIKALTARKTSLETNFQQVERQAHDALAAITGKIKELDVQAAEKQRDVARTDQVVAQVREFAGNVEQVYRVAGIVFNGPVREAFQRTKLARVEHLPAQALLTLAGSILNVAETMNGDHTFDIPRSAENVVPIKLRLSEIPLLFAGKEYYQGQRDLTMQQLTAMAEMEGGEED